MTQRDELVREFVWFAAPVALGDPTASSCSDDTLAQLLCELCPINDPASQGTGMTRKVLIVNLDERPVLARLYLRPQKPGEVVQILHAEFLGPQTHGEFFIHEGVGLMLDEDDEGKLAPPVP